MIAAHRPGIPFSPHTVAHQRPLQDVRPAPEDVGPALPDRRHAQVADHTRPNSTTDTSPSRSAQPTAPTRPASFLARQIRTVQRLIRNWRILHRQFWNPHIHRPTTAPTPNHEHTTDKFSSPPNTTHATPAPASPTTAPLTGNNFSPPPNATHSTPASAPPTTAPLNRNDIPRDRTALTRSPLIDRGPAHDRPVCFSAPAFDVARASATTSHTEVFEPQRSTRTSTPFR